MGIWFLRALSSAPVPARRRTGRLVSRPDGRALGPDRLLVRDDPLADGADPTLPISLDSPSKRSAARWPAWPARRPATSFQTRCDRSIPRGFENARASCPPARPTWMRRFGNQQDEARGRGPLRSSGNGKDVYPYEVAHILSANRFPLRRNVRPGSAPRGAMAIAHRHCRRDLIFINVLPAVPRHGCRE